MEVPLERIMGRVRKTETCWLWTGAKSHGYGYLYLSRDGGGTPKTVQAHRAMWALVNGPIPDGLLICHHCDVPNCVNPAHLFLGTYSDNTLDAVRKGRWKGGGRSREAAIAAIDQQLADLRQRLAAQGG